MDKAAEKTARDRRWDLRYIELANHVRQWSKDPRGQVGAVITSPTLGRVVSLGFNGFPINIEDDAERLDDSDAKLTMMIHAEENALLYAGRAARDCHIYVVGKPVCSHCALLIIQAGIKRVIAAAPSEDNASKWNATGRQAVAMFEEAGVLFSPISDEDAEPLLADTVASHQAAPPPGAIH